MPREIDTTSFSHLTAEQIDEITDLVHVYDDARESLLALIPAEARDPHSVDYENFIRANPRARRQVRIFIVSMAEAITDTFEILVSGALAQVTQIVKDPDNPLDPEFDSQVWRMVRNNLVSARLLGDLFPAL